MTKDKEEEWVIIGMVDNSSSNNNEFTIISPVEGTILCSSDSDDDYNPVFNNTLKDSIYDLYDDTGRSDAKSIVGADEKKTKT